MNQRAPYIYWSALILASYAVMYSLRAFDRNVLFSWSDVFSSGMAEIFLLFILCLMISYSLSGKIKINEKWDLSILFFGAFLLGAVFWGAPEIHPDAGRYFAEAKYVEEFGPLSFIRDWGTELNVMSDFPATPLFYGLIFRYMGESKVYIQIFLTALFAASCALTYLVGRRLWRRDTGIYAALFLASSPYLLSYVFMLVEIPLLFFLTASVYSTLNALDNRRGEVWILASVVFILLTVLTKASGIILLSVIPAIFLVSFIKTGDKKALYRSASIVALSGTLIFLFVSYKFDVLAHIFQLLAAFKSRTIVSHENSLSLLFFQISPLITLLAISSIYFALKRKNYNCVILFVWFFVPFILLYNTRIRFTAPALPALAIMAALGLSEIRPDSSRKFLAFGIILCSIAIAVFGYLPFMYAHSEMNVKYAAEYTNALESKTIEVYVFLPDGYVPNFPAMEVDHRHTLDILIPIFDLYSGKEIATPKYGRGYEPPGTDFTWQYNYPPPYYSRQISNLNPILIISPKITQTLPENLEKRLINNYSLAKVYSEREFSRRGPYAIKVYLPASFHP